MWYLDDKEFEDNVVPEVEDENAVGGNENAEEAISEENNGSGNSGVNLNIGGNKGDSKQKKSEMRNNSPTEQSQAAIDDLNEKKNQRNDDNFQNESSQSAENSSDNSTGATDPMSKIDNGSISKDTKNPTSQLGNSGNASIIAEGINGLQEDGIQGAAKGVAKEVGKQKIKKELLKRGVDVFLKSLGAAIGPVLAGIAVVLLILIVAVGILMFFVAMPGQITGKVKNLGTSIMTAWSEFLSGAEDNVPLSRVASVANYIESMGYDLKGEGFVSSDKVESDKSKTISELSKEEDESLSSLTAGDIYLDPNGQGVFRRNSDAKVVDINSDPILTYIISDNLCYIVKNFNTNLNEMGESEGGVILGIIVGVAAVLGAICAIIFSPVAAVLAIVGTVGGSMLAAKIEGNPNWGTGLISIWHEKDGVIGLRGSNYAGWEKGDITLDAETKQLSVKRGWANGTYVFNIDGWSGRYGMPLEFLLSVHLATQMPDLSIDIATSFDTNVEVLLHEVDGEMTAGILKQGHSPSSDTDFVIYETVSRIGIEERGILADAGEAAMNVMNFLMGLFTGERPWSEEELQVLTFTPRSMYKLFKEGVPHSVNCTCCSHIPGSLGQGEDSCSGDTEIYNEIGSGDLINDHVICEDCQNRLIALVAALQVTNDNKWESYTPYISKVTDHWFRDVYFVMNEDENEYQSVIKVDEDYFYQTNERWTIYETYTKKDESDGKIPEGFEVGDYKLYKEGSDEPSTKTKAEVQEINEKIALGDTSLTRLVKKAITQDLSKNYNSTDWSAYEITSDDNKLPWEQMSVDKDSVGELTIDEVYADEDASTPDDILIYYQETRPADIKQIEDGQRTETNSKIKEMFLNNTYYKYDGSVSKADAIMEDRKKSESEQDEKLKAKVNINKDSLGAFSILENTHTLDADYIYRDFKELIVELNYFDKEDLSAKIETVMQWVIPECDSAGWPIRKYEKGENFYGTLINSKIDLAYMKKKDVENAELTLEELQNEVETDEPGGGTSGVATGSVAEMVTKGYEIHKTMEDNGYDYCVLRPGNGCNHQYGHGCGLNESIAEAQAGHHNTCCATYVSWILNEMGFGFVSHGAKNTYDWCEGNGWTAITDYSSLQPGDLLFNKAGYSGSDTSNIGHVQMLGNNGEWLNAGSVSAINDPPKVYNANFIIGMRSTLNGAAAEFKGYDPDQAVVAPVTGKIVEYGSVERDNIETGEKETVDFIKIQVLDHYITSYEGDYVTETGCLTSDTEFKPENSCDSAKEGYDYFYEEYKGVIDGCVLYIEGFDLTLEETLGNSDFSSEDVTRYEPNTVYNMTDDLKEAQALWREDAKKEAAPYFKDGEDIYIKEGTVIGKTYEDKEFGEGAKGNGNYIRLILRDLEDSIMENVETYFDIPQSYSFNGSVGNIQNIDSADQSLMSLIEQLAGPLEGQYPGIVNILKAISMNESGGGTNPAAGDDPMQAVESTGGAAGDSIGGWENSVRAGINALTSAWDKARGYGINDLRVVIQAYNFGSGFVDYTHNKGVNAYSKSLVEQFSDEQAAKHGWSRYGDKNYVDPKIYNYLPDLNV